MERLRVNTDALTEIARHLNGVSQALENSAQKLGSVDFEDIGHPQLNISGFRLNTSGYFCEGGTDLEELLAEFSKALKETDAATSRISNRVNQCIQLFSECENQIASAAKVKESGMTLEEMGFEVPVMAAKASETNGQDTSSYKMEKEEAENLLKFLFGANACDKSGFWWWRDYKDKNIKKYMDILTNEGRNSSEKDRKKLKESIEMALHKRSNGMDETKFNNLIEGLRNYADNYDMLGPFMPDDYGEIVDFLRNFKEETGNGSLYEALVRSINETGKNAVPAKDAIEDLMFIMTSSKLLSEEVNSETARNALKAIRDYKDTLPSIGGGTAGVIEHGMGSTEKNMFDSVKNRDTQQILVSDNEMVNRIFEVYTHI